MNGRRRFARYILFAPLQGLARTFSDCVVESWDEDSGVVVTGHLARNDERLVLQVSSPGGAAGVYPVRVVSCELDARHGPLRYRLHVRVTAGPDQPRGTLHSHPRAPRGPARR